MDYIVHGILQARILEWVAFPFSRGSSQPRNWTGVSCFKGGFFTNWAIREALRASSYFYRDLKGTPCALSCGLGASSLCRLRDSNSQNPKCWLCKCQRSSVRTTTIQGCWWIQWDAKCPAPECALGSELQHSYFPFSLRSLASGVSGLCCGWESVRQTRWTSEYRN